jgi:hypothetical protein
MLRIILLILLILIVACLLYATTRPNLVVERSVVIHAPAEKIYPLINNFHEWSAWSPWEKLDPSMQRTYSGPESGRGAGYAWHGNSKAGQGLMEITDSAASTHVTIKLDFIKPFEGHNIAEFTLTQQDDSTVVKWTMLAQSSYTEKLIGVFVNMDKMIGKDFELGLANLKEVSEKSNTNRADL